MAQEHRVKPPETDRKMRISQIQRVERWEHGDPPREERIDGAAGHSCPGCSYLQRAARSYLPIVVLMPQLELP